MTLCHYAGDWLACKQALAVEMAHGRNIGAWLLVQKLVTKPLYFDRSPFSTEEPAGGLVIGGHCPPVHCPIVSVSPEIACANLQGR